MYHFQLEPVADIIANKALTEEHRSAVPIETNATFSPDLEQYQSMQDLGMLHCISVNHNDVMVGYIAMIIQENRHNPGRLAAHVDAVYVQPEHRPAVGKRILQVAEDYAAGLGCETILHQVMEGGRDFSKVLERMGYCKHSVTYSRRLQS